MTPAPEEWVGREVDELSLIERRELTGYWIALPIYTPETLPLRRMTAIGVTVAQCVAQLEEQGLDATKFELQLVQPPYLDPVLR